MGSLIVCISKIHAHENCQGSWGGAGTRPNPKANKFIKRVAGIDPKSRADHGKPHLIISEKKDKKAAKYLTKDLPYPYTSKAQFERSMEVPVGTEWNTRVGFQRQTLPRVVKKVRIRLVRPFSFVHRKYCRWARLSIHWRNCFDFSNIYRWIYCII